MSHFLPSVTLKPHLLGCLSKAANNLMSTDQAISFEKMLISPPNVQNCPKWLKFLYKNSKLGQNKIYILGVYIFNLTGY